MVGRDQYGYTKGPYYMVKPGPMPPGGHSKVESKKLHKLGRFPKLRATSAAGKAFSQLYTRTRELKRLSPRAVINVVVTPSHWITSINVWVDAVTT